MVAVAASQALAGASQPFSPSSYRLAASFETKCQHTGTTAVVVLDQAIALLLGSPA